MRGLLVGALTAGVSAIEPGLPSKTSVLTATLRAIGAKHVSSVARDDHAAEDRVIVGVRPPQFRGDAEHAQKVRRGDLPPQPAGRVARIEIEPREAARGHAPLPFPWRRFAAGVLACTAWAACGVWLAQSGSLSFFADPVATLASVTTELEYAAATSPEASRRSSS